MKIKAKNKLRLKNKSRLQEQEYVSKKNKIDNMNACAGKFANYLLFLFPFHPVKHQQRYQNRPGSV